MATLDLSATSQASYDAIAAIEAESNVDLDDCYQCGKCSAGCPMSHEMDLLPRQLIRLLQLGQAEQVLRSKTPWVCADCMVCSARCPQEVDIANIMLAVRRGAKRRGIQPLREPDVFDDLFVGNIRSFGKSNEALLAAKYNLISGHLFQDLTNAFGMLGRGLIGPKLHKVQNRAAVKDLVERVLAQGASKADANTGSGAEAQTGSGGSGR